jgi:hypothetical protein
MAFRRGEEVRFVALSICLREFIRKVLISQFIFDNLNLLIQRLTAHETHFNVDRVHLVQLAKEI